MSSYFHPVDDQIYLGIGDFRSPCGHRMYPSLWEGIEQKPFEWKWPPPSEIDRKILDVLHKRVEAAYMGEDLR